MVRITGWTYDRRLPTEAVIITIDGAPAATTTTGVARPDILEVRQHSAAASCGFSVYVDLSAYEGREVSLGGRAVRAHGIVDELRPATFAVAPATKGLGPPLAGMPREEPVGALGSFDLPKEAEEVEGDVLYLRGGVLFPGSRTARVHVEVDGERVGLARTFLQHHTAADHSPHVDAPVAAWEMHVVVEGYPRPSEVVLSVTAESLDGRTWQSETKRVLLAERPEAEPEDVGRGEELARRTAASLRPVPAAERDGLLVLTHELSLGGGQLWLWDLVRQLHVEPGLRCQVVATADGPLRRRLEAIGIDVHVTAPLERVGAPDAYEGRVRELALLAERSGCRAALVNTLGMFAGADAAQRAGLPTVWAIHESYPIPVWLSFGNGPDAVDPYVRGRLDHVLASSAGLVFEARQTSELFAPLTDRRFVVSYGVDLDEIDRFRATFDRPRARAEAGFAEHERVILVMGVFEPRKAQGAVLAAFDELARVHPETTLVLVGAHTTEYTTAVVAQAERSGLRRRVRIEPVTPDVYDWYGMADLFLLASDVESLPRSVLESMAFELPVATTGIWGLVDLIRDGENGWLFTPRDLESLTGTMHRVLGLEPDDCANVARAARKDVEEQHGLEAYARSFAAAFQALAEDPGTDLRTVLEPTRAAVPVGSSS
jgi:D-inositol-3-phosphate glycosyltransferase